MLTVILTQGNGFELLLSKHKPSKPHRESGRDRTCTASWQTVHCHKRVGKYPKLGCAVKSRMPRIEEDASKRAREAKAATHGKG